MSKQYRFADLTLDVGRRRVARNGQALHLGKLTYDMLVALIEAAPNIVMHDQLVKSVWGGRMATPETVTQRIKLLRDALGDETSHPRYIEVIRGQGYRLIPPVECVAPAGPGVAASSSVAPSEILNTAPSRRLRPWLLAGGALLVAAAVLLFAWHLRNQERVVPPPLVRQPAQATLKSIAVLPFADMSEGKDHQYFSDGLSEEILNLLAQSPELRVIARTSSFSFRGEKVDVATVAGRLKVSHVLEGSVRKSGNQVRITAQLVDAETSLHLWSQTYDRELNDIFDVQTDIATSVAGALRVALAEGGRPGNSRNPQAFERALRAQFFFNRRASGDLERASVYFQQALDLDPEFARAWAGLAGVYWIQNTALAALDEPLLEKQRSAAQRALALDPDLTEAHIRMANYLWATGDRSAARGHWHRAAALEPNNPLLLSMAAWDVTRDGRPDEGIDMLRRVTSADPLSVSARHNLAHMLLLTGHLQEAKVESLRIPELDASQPADIAALVFIIERDFDAALKLIQDAPDSPQRSQCLALIYHALGRQADADAALKQLIASDGAHESLLIAEVHAYRGEIDESFDWLEQAAGIPRFRRANLMSRSPFLQPLHADARWKAWAASVE